MSHALLRFLTGIVLLLTLAACSPRKGAALADPAAGDMNSALRHGPYSWDWFSCNGQVKMESSLFSGSGNYTLRMSRDSLVWMVIKYAGLELARLQANRDSVVLINRWERTVDVYTWPEVQAQTGFPASLHSLQRLVLGWLPLAPDHWQITAQEGNTLEILARKEELQIQASFEEPSYQMSHCRFWHTGNGAEIKGRQEGWTQVGQRPLPHARLWEMKPDPASRVFLQVLIQDAAFSGPLSFPFSVPDRYSRGG